MFATLHLLNEDSDAEFLANPRIGTADNQEAKIEIIRNPARPTVELQQTNCAAVFGGLQDKKFGNTRGPVLGEQRRLRDPEREARDQQQVADATFTFAGATVATPIIDTRTLDSNMLTKSGDTRAIGDLLQDEVTKARSKMPVLGDIPALGLFLSGAPERPHQAQPAGLRHPDHSRAPYGMSKIR